MSERKQLFLWLLWLVTLPPFTYFMIENTYAVWQAEWLSLVSFIVLMIIVSLFPIHIHQTPIVAMQAVVLAIFLHFGILIEAIIIQIGLLTTLISLRLPKRDIYRFPLNSLIFLYTSILSGLLFFLAGGQIGSITTGNIENLLFPIVVYMTAYVGLNQVFIYIIKYFLLSHRETRFFDKALVWESLTGLLAIPVGISFAILFQEIGYMAIFLVGIPIISLSLILKLYNRSQNTGVLLHKVSSFGYEVNDSLKVDEIVALFFDTCSKVFPVTGVYLYEHTKDGMLRPIFIDNPANAANPSLTNSDGVSDYVFKTGKSVKYGLAKQWKSYHHVDVFNDAQSVLSTPAIRNHQVVGVATLTSNKSNSFNDSDQMLLEIMANYLIVAIQNTRNLEKTKSESERCGLTNLYNFRYFENLLIDQYGDRGCADYAIVLIDLDHFKRVNDKYGHQSGNTVLYHVAKLIKDTMGEAGVVARYGGEEFVVLLEGVSLNKATKISEKLRIAIEDHLFHISEDLHKRERIAVQITASIGVATKKEVDESPISVLRNADRAMYTGAKQQGRNKVAQF